MVEGPLEEPTFDLCGSCGAQQAFNFRYCSACGQLNANIREKQTRVFERQTGHLVQLAWYGGCLLALLLLGAFSDESWQMDGVFGSIMAILIVCFLLYDGPSVWRIILPERVKIFPLLVAILAATVSSTLVPPLVDAINERVMGYSPPLTELYPSGTQGMVLALLFIAVFPAVFEELAFRGFVFRKVEAITRNPNSALWASSILFAMVHFSFLSLFWLLPFGLFLGWLRLRYQTLLYGMVAHFLHNGLVVMQEFEGWSLW